jgi:hypothetical protein
MNKQDSSGAFSADGKAYVIQTPNTPAAGANYLFNKNFFAYVTQTGQGESRALWPAKICLHQTAPAHQSLLRNKRKCCQNTDLDRHLRLPARGAHEKAAEHRAVALHNSTDFECVRFRKNAAFTGISEHGLLRRRWRLL